jgi:cytochrome c-type biogenesis protein CcmH
MTPFLIAAALLLLASLALLTRPWWRRGRADGASRRALNTTIYRDQLVELERDRNAGQLGDADYQEARGEIQRRLLDDATDADVPMTIPGHRWRALIAMLVAFPLLAGGLYTWLGTPAALDQMARRDFTRQDVENMVAGLAAKLEKDPQNVKGWIMLARSYKAMRRYDEAERAFEKIISLVPQDPQLLADYADLLATKAGGNLAGRPEQLVAKALALDPNNLQTLWLAGTAAYNRRDFATAVEHWQHGLRQLPPESEDAQTLDKIIAEAKQQMGGGTSGTSMAGAGKASAAMGAAAAASTSGVSGRVELAAALKAQAAPSDLVFILARADGGSPMPLAVKRVHVADLPLDFTLDDRDAVMPQQVLSSAKSVRIEARIAKGGDAKSRPGDLSGAVGPVKPGVKGLRITIDTVVK